MMSFLSDLGLEPYSTDSIEIGATFGSLQVMHIARRIGTYRYVAVCKCACGKFPHVARIDGLKNGSVLSCGCGQRKAVTKHGNYKNPLQSKWRNMMSRCYDQKDKRYADWGGRGIHVCNRWHEAQNFIDDMQPTYFDEAQIDRIDNSGDYSPENCRWVTCTENNRNKRNSVFLTWEGKTQTVSAWAKELGLTDKTIHNRIKIYKWSVEKTLSTKALNAHERLALARKARWG